MKLNLLKQAFRGAVERAVGKIKASGQEAHVLDLGSGTGFLSCCAAAAGADSIIACDLHAPMCDLTRKVRHALLPLQHSEIVSSVLFNAMTSSSCCLVPSPWTCFYPAVVLSLQ